MTNVVGLPQPIRRGWACSIEGWINRSGRLRARECLRIVVFVEERRRFEIVAGCLECDAASSEPPPPAAGSGTSARAICRPATDWLT